MLRRNCIVNTTRGKIETQHQVGSKFSPGLWESKHEEYISIKYVSLTEHQLSGPCFHIQQKIKYSNTFFYFIIHPVIKISFFSSAYLKESYCSLHNSDLCVWEWDETIYILSISIEVLKIYKNGKGIILSSSKRGLQLSWLLAQQLIYSTFCRTNHFKAWVEFPQKIIPVEILNILFGVPIRPKPKTLGS